jgi:hypothetical protein
LRNDLLGSSFEEEIYLDVSTGSNITENACSIFVINNNWGLSIRVSEEYSEIISWLLALHESKWMHSMAGLTSISIVIAGDIIVGPHGPCSLTDGELMLSLSKSVDSLTW